MDAWVKEFDTCTASELAGKAAAFAKASDYVIACYTDRFLAVRAEMLSALPSFETLLELRVFNEERELWGHRSSIGSRFSWRIADDLELVRRAAQEPDDFLRQPENRYLDSCQTLDIDTTESLETDEFGSRKLRTTVGGDYALPISDGDGCIQIRSYLRYDKNGVATVADYRLVGFGPQKRG